ncbi:MAG: hypothetical protein J6X81_04415 [Muribaculaceae bacterium]|nr:hypothetical protein [Muribaculaceae bacterium]
MIKKLLLFLMMATASVVVYAQAYCGEHQFDGDHKNEVSGYIVAGDNVVSGAFGGFAGSYTRHLTPRWHVGGDMQMQFWKQLYSFDVTGGYRLPVKYGHLYFDGKFMLNRYSRWGATETIFNLAATWESAYVDIRLGESLIHIHTHGRFSNGSGYTEPLTLTFGFGANIRHRSNPWNVGLFFRNYDEFYYENWNINWGIRWYAKVKDQWRLFGEFNIRPAGSISQLASKYEGSVKVGLKYKW